jgi:hypothetical protein
MSQDAIVDTEIFRKDHPMILACLRHQAMILPVRLSYVSGGYVAGQVLAKNTVTAMFEKYNDAGGSGANVAKCVLLDAAEPAVGDTLIARAVFKGHVYKDKLTGLDAAGITDLGARTISDSSGLGDILSF